MHTTRNAPVFVRNSEEDQGKLIASFAFSLIDVFPAHAIPPDQMAAFLFRFHRKVFNAVSNSRIDCNIRLSIGKLKRKERIQRYFFVILRFTISGDTRQAIRNEAILLQRELELILCPEDENGTTLWRFTPVAEPEEIFETCGELQGFVTYRYMRKPVWFRVPHATIGYKVKPGNAEMRPFVPQFFIPDYEGINTMASRIARSDGDLVLTLTLVPVKLSDDTIRELKLVPEKCQLEDEHFTTIERTDYEQHLDILLDDHTTRFAILVELAAPGNHLLGNSLHNTIADTFFGNIQSVNITRTPSASIPFQHWNDAETLIPWLYPQEIAQYIFRLPYQRESMHYEQRLESEVFYTNPCHLAADGVLMGKHEGKVLSSEVRISRNDLARHLYVLGQTGVGKTTLLRTMILDQIGSGDGVCVVDPHGDLVQQIRENLPAERANDLIWFDPTEEHNMRINILEYDPRFPEQKTFIFNELVKILDEIYDLRHTGGPMFETFLKNGMLLIMEQRGTLHDLYRLFHDEKFRDDLLLSSKQPETIRFFKNADKMVGEMSAPNFTLYITSKLNRFVQDDFIGPLVAETKSNISFRSLMDERKILLVRLPKGRLGSDGVQFVGTLLFNRIIMAAFTRENIRYNERIPYYLYVDEFQNFTSEDMETALSESRKYGLRMVLANQTLSQLSSTSQQILLGNVGSQVFFRPGPFDLEVLTPMLKHSITEKEILTIPNFNAIARLQHNNMPVKPFILTTLKGKD